MPKNGSEDTLRAAAQVGKEQAATAADEAQNWAARKANLPRSSMRPIWLTIAAVAILGYALEHQHFPKHEPPAAPKSAEDAKNDH